MTIRQRIEENIAIWLLGTLLTGFLAGVATYKSVQEIGGLEPSPKATRLALEATVKQCQSEVEDLRRSRTTLGQENYQAAASLASCKAQLDSAVRAKKAIASTDSPAPAKTTVRLDGLTVYIDHLNHRASHALRAKQKLESSGAHVVLKAFHNEKPPLLVGGNVYYWGNEYMPKAMAVLSIVREFGVSQTNLFQPNDAPKMFITLD